MSVLVFVHAAAAPSLVAPKVEWTSTARDGSTLQLLKDQSPLTMKAASEKPKGPALIVDRTKKFQEFAGFGGAFTEAAAINWRKLDAAKQQEVIDLYFGAPEDGGLGYTMGRVPINSCDFSPASYTFDDVRGDTNLDHFDSSVAHDVDNGMVPMILAAQAKAKSRGERVKLLASPWSPPAWMKLPVNGVQSMLASAKPNGLDPKMQRPWATYFSKWIDAYKAHGVDVWGVTVQNEPEAVAGWEAMLWTPSFMASFVKDHLGPVLKAAHPEVLIVGLCVLRLAPTHLAARTSPPHGCTIVAPSSHYCYNFTLSPFARSRAPLLAPTLAHQRPQ